MTSLRRFVFIFFSALFLFFPDGLRAYQYCDNDPVNRHDPLGLSPNGYRGRAFIRAHVKDPKQRDAMLREFDELWDDSQRYGYVGPAALSLPLAAVALPELGVLGGDLALKSYVTLQTSSIAHRALTLLGGYHLYNFATDAQYRGQTISVDGGTGFSSVYFAVDDVFSAGHSILAHPRLNTNNYNWNAFFTPISGGYTYTGFPIPGVPRFNPKPYAFFNKTHAGSLPAPKGVGPGGARLQSHHGLQQEWAIQNLSEYKYNPQLAPTITIETGRGFPHSIISKLQNARRNARLASGMDKWSSSLQDELGYIVDDFRAAGFSDDVITQVLEQQYKMLDHLGVTYQRIPGFGTP